MSKFNKFIKWYTELENRQWSQQEQVQTPAIASNHNSPSIVTAFSSSSLASSSSSQSSFSFSASSSVASASALSPASSPTSSSSRVLSSELPLSILRVFSRSSGDYFVAYGRTALYIADIYYQSRIAVHRELEDDVSSSYINISSRKLSTILSDSLRRRKLQVEIWTEDGSGSGPGAGESQWKCKYRGTPGNWSTLEPFIKDDIESDNVVASIYLSSGSILKPMVSVAILDSRKGQVRVGEFTDTRSLYHLELLLVRFGVCECIAYCPQAKHKHNQNEITKSLEDLTLKLNLPLTAVPKSVFAEDSTVYQLFTNGSQIRAIEASENILATLSAVSNFTGLTLTTATSVMSHGKSQQYRLHMINLEDRMKLDFRAHSALNLFAPQHQHRNDNSSTTSLFGLLSCTLTKMGSRQLSDWIKQPLTEINAINDRLDIVEYFVSNTSLRMKLRESCLQRLPDIDQLLIRLQRKTAGLQEVVKIYQFLLFVQRAIELLDGEEVDSQHVLFTSYIKPARDNMSETTKIIEMVEAAIDIGALKRHGRYLIDAHLHPDLLAVKQELDKLVGLIEEDRVATEQKLSTTVKVTINRNAFYRVTKKFDKIIRDGHKKGIISSILETRKDGVRFTTKALTQYSRQHETKFALYESLQQQALEEMLEVVGEYISKLEHLSSLIADLDILLSFSHVAATSPHPYVRPQLVPNGKGNSSGNKNILKLKNSRHPCMENIDGLHFIPNDIDLKRDESHLAVITGPNAGGKSTFIRQIGVIVVMAQIGSFVSCDSAVLSIVDAIYARVGAMDFQLNGVSTFYNEMLDTSSIVQNSTENSLCILDELGRGTSTEEGYGVCYAIAEFLASQRKCFTLFATHFHELTRLENEISGVVNLFVSARTSALSAESRLGASSVTDTATQGPSLTFLYKVLPGSCNQSFGIEVMRLAHFPAHIIKNAYEYLDLLVAGGKPIREEPASGSRKRKLPQMAPNSPTMIDDVCESKIVSE